MIYPTTKAGREHVTAWWDIADMAEAVVAIEAEARGQITKQHDTVVAVTVLHRFRHPSRSLEECDCRMRVGDILAQWS